MTDTTTPKPFAWIGHSSSTGESVLLYDAVAMPVACRLDGDDTTLAIGVEGIEPLVTRGGVNLHPRNADA